MCVFMSDKLFDAEACDIGGQAASATNGLSDMKTTPSKTHRIIDPLRLLADAGNNKSNYDEQRKRSGQTDRIVLPYISQARTI
jgi:hypothetical protein